MIVYTVDEFNDFIDELKQQKLIAFDTETDGLDPYIHKQCGISIAFEDYRTFYLPFRHTSGEKQLDLSLVKVLLNTIKDNNITIVGHNIKFDAKMIILNEDFDMREIDMIDTLILMRLVNDNETNYKLKFLGRKYVEAEAADEEKAIKTYLRKNKLTSYADIPIEMLGPYAEKDVELTLKLYHLHRPTIDEENLNIIYELEHKLMKHLITMELIGVKINVEFANKMLNSEHDFSEMLKKRIYDIAGEEFDILSNKQLTGIMAKLNISSPIVGKNGDIWKSEVLSEIDHEIAPLIAFYRTSSTLQSTYYEMLATKCDADGRLHCNFKQQGTRTGRFSCAQPNLQNIPSLHVYGFSDLNKGIDSVKAIDKCGIKLHPIDRDISLVRRCFVPSPNCKLFMFDYKQMELRVFVDYANETSIIDLIETGVDAHTAFANILFGDEIMGDMSKSKLFREMVKDINFGLLYGMGAKSLARRLHKTVPEAKELMENYYATYPNIRAFMVQVMKKIRNRGYIFNKYKRRRRLYPDEAYKGINSLIQGGCGDMLKDKMIQISEYLADKKSNLLLTVHDELVFDIDNTEYFEVIPKIAEIMRDYKGMLKVKMDVDIEHSAFSWIDKVTFDEKLFDMHKEMQSCTKCPLHSIDCNKTDISKGHGKLIGYGGCGSILFVAQNPSHNRFANCITPIDAGICKSFVDLYTEVTNHHNFYITNLVKCSTENNEDVPDESVKVCTEAWLDAEIQQIKPKMIVPLGKQAADFFNGSFNTLSTWKDIPVFPLYHPSYVKRRPDLKDKYIQNIKDMKKGFDKICKRK